MNLKQGSPMSNDHGGYQKPPQHSQFKKGRSGNPNGRPKKTKHLKTDLVEELAEQIVVHEGERPLRITKQRAVIKRLVAATVKGDPRMTTNLTKMMYLLLDLGDESAPIDEPLDADEREILQVLRERIARTDALASEVPAADTFNARETTEEEVPETNGGES